MLTRVKQRTRMQDEYRILTELQHAYGWVLRRVYNTEKGPNLLITIDEELSINATTRDYDLASNLAHALLGVKQLWLKLPSDTTFTPMVTADTNSSVFVVTDSASITATGHPVFYDVVNFDKVRFAPALPSGSTIRVDYYRLAPDLDPTTDNSPTSSHDLPEIFHDAVVSKTTAQVYGLLDDTREITWEQRAVADLQEAVYVANRRVQAPTQTEPFRSRRRRFI